MAAQKVQASTQQFTEIIDFVGSTVVLAGGNACTIIEITSNNFLLLSQDEQESRIASYAGLLNSLSFPIQILIRNKRMDISAYLNELDNVIAKTENEQLSDYITYYRSFVEEMTTVNVVLNKAFYVIIPYTALEAGAAGVTQTQFSTKAHIDKFANTARKTLEAKTATILGQLQRFSLSAKILDQHALVALFYDLYNDGQKIDSKSLSQGMNTTIITKEQSS